MAEAQSIEGGGGGGGGTQGSIIQDLIDKVKLKNGESKTRDILKCVTLLQRTVTS